MFTHAGVEALLAGIPTALLMTLKDTAQAQVSRTVRGAFERAEGAAGEAVQRVAGKFQVSAPVVVGAVIITAAVVHGALRGKRAYEQRSFAEQEEERRSEGVGAREGR